MKFLAIALIAYTGALRRKDTTDPSSSNPSAPMNAHAEYMYNVTKIGADNYATVPRADFIAKKGSDPTEVNDPLGKPTNKHADTMYNITKILPDHFGTAAVQYDIHEEWQPTDPTPRFPPQETVIPAHPNNVPPINNHAHTMYNITKI